MKWPLTLTIVIGASVTTLVTLLTLLKPSSISEIFWVPVILNKADQLPIYQDITTDKKVLFRSTLYSLRNMPLESAQNVPDTREMTFADSEKKIEFYSEAVQLALFSEVFTQMCHKDTIGWSSGIPVEPGEKLTMKVIRKSSGRFLDFREEYPAEENAKSIVHIALKPHLTPPNAYTLSYEDLMKVISGNQFSNPLKPANYWMNFGFPLPRYSRLLFPDKSSFVIERSGYYRISFKVLPIGLGDGVPYHLGEIAKGAELETIAYRIELTANFDRLSAENPDTLNVKEWVAALFGALKKDLAEEK